ncbi:MAG: PKD domain-containing protein [Thermoplasmatota archaeon]
MQKKIICIVLSMLLCATISTVTGTKNEADANVFASIHQGFESTLAPWDLLAEIDIGATGQTGANGNAGAEFDGTYLYSTRWQSNLIHRYDINGNLVEEFSIPGVSGLRDLAFDGTYMWGGAAAGTIWKMNFTSKTLVATITGSFQCRAIAYDYDQDIIYCKNWGDPVYKVNPSNGATIGTFNIVSITSTYGIAYDPNPSGGPFLWFVDQGDGTDTMIYQWDIAAGAFTGVTHDVNQEVGSGVGIAGGLWASEDYQSGLFCIGGCVQDSSAPGVTDWLYVYELYPTNLPPETPGAPSGPSQGVVGVEYTFTATTTDPEGDPIEYWFDWGDGSNSGWVSPGSAKHAWASEGTYDVKVKARDAIHGGESGFSPAHQILILGGPILDIKTVKGGILKVKALITNTGGLDAENVQWSITLEGGAFIGKESSGTVNVPVGTDVEITSKPIIGFGSTKVTVTVTHPDSSDTTTRSGKIFLIYIYVRPGG